MCVCDWGIRNEVELVPLACEVNCVQMPRAISEHLSKHSLAKKYRGVYEQRMLGNALSYRCKNEV